VAAVAALAVGAVAATGAPGAVPAAHPVTARAVAAIASALFAAQILFFCTMTVTSLITGSSSNDDDSARGEVAAVTLK
jgi:hypothetical protein